MLLTPEEKVKKILAIREKKKREKKLRPPYVPNAGQLPVHKCEKLNRFNFSGNGAGKTALAVNEAIWAAKGYNPVLDKFTTVPAKIIVVLDLPDKVDSVWIPELKKWIEITDDMLHKHGKPYYTEVRFKNGSSINFMFHQQDQLAFESLELDVAILDEPPPRNIWVALQRGGRKKSGAGRFLLVGTPISAAWLREMIYEPWTRGELPEVMCFRTGTHVNEANLAKGYMDNFSKFLTENEKRVRLEGDFFDSSALALAHLFKRSTHVIRKEYFEKYIYKKDMPVVIAVDPHPSKMHHACMLGVDDKEYYYYISEIARKEVPRQFAKTLKEWMRGYRVIDVVCDSLGNAEMTGGEGFRSFIEVLISEGVRIRGTTFQEKSDEDFIERIRSILAKPDKPDNFGLYTPKLRIVEGNDGIIKNIENARFYKHKDMDLNKENIDSRALDYLSCLKYGLASNLHYGKVSKERSYAPKQLYGFKL